MRARIITIAMVFSMVIATGCSVTRDQKTVDIHVDDKIITATIVARHAESTTVPITNISVETLYGVVLLSGIASSLQEKITATKIAWQVDGVKAVHDDIVMQPDATDRNTVPAPSVNPTLFL